MTQTPLLYSAVAFIPIAAPGPTVLLEQAAEGHFERDRLKTHVVASL